MQLLPLLLSLPSLLVSETPLPLLLLDLHVLRAITFLLQLQTLEVQSATIQVVFGDTTQVVVVLNDVISVDLLLVTWDIKEVWHIRLWGSTCGVTHDLLLESLQGSLGHGHSLNLTCLGLRGLELLLLTKTILSVFNGLLHKLGHG
jgi:hypothetical protein